MVDSADVRFPTYAAFLPDVNNVYFQSEKFDTARFELHQLLGQPNLVGVPLLVVRTTIFVHNMHS